MKLSDVVEPERERPFAQLLWSLRRLGFPLLPRDVRLARMQEVVDREASRKALRVFGLQGVTVTGLGSVPPGESSAGSLELRPDRSGGMPLSWGSRIGRLGWDGQVLTVARSAGDLVRLRPSGDGVRPGYRADEVARTGVRPSPALAECPSAVVEIAAVAVEGQRMQRLLFLDEASRCLAVTPAAGLSEDGVADLARHAGIAFRVYWISLGARVPGSLVRLQRELRFEQGRLARSEVYDAVFPLSARFRTVGEGMGHVEGWRFYWD